MNINSNVLMSDRPNYTSNVCELFVRNDFNNIRTSNDIGIRIKFNNWNDSGEKNAIIIFENEQFIKYQENLCNLLYMFQKEIQSSKERNNIKKITKRSLNEIIQKDNQVITALNNLVKLGYQFYSLFSSKMERNKECKPQFKTWKELFESNKGFGNKSIEKRISIEFMCGITFPFGLLFLKNPNEFNWDSDLINFDEIIDGFFDNRALIFNSFNNSEITHNRPIYTPFRYLKENKEDDIAIVHAINKDLDVKREKESWKIDKAIKSVSYAYDKEKFREKLFQNSFPQIVHLSAHLDFCKIEKCYKIMLSENDIIKIEDIENNNYFRQLNEQELPALFFFNTCNSGTSIVQFRRNFIEVLFPDYALGFIVTMFKVLNDDAGIFAKKFYQNFFKGVPLLDALQKTKRDLINNYGIYSAIGYTIWQACPDLKYYLNQNINRRVINKRKKT